MIELFRAKHKLRLNRMIFFCVKNLIYFFVNIWICLCGSGAYLGGTGVGGPLKYNFEQITIHFLIVRFQAPLPPFKKFLDTPLVWMDIGFVSSVLFVLLILLRIFCVILFMCSLNYMCILYLKNVCRKTDNQGILTWAQLWL